MKTFCLKQAVHEVLVVSYAVHRYIKCSVGDNGSTWGGDLCTAMGFFLIASPTNYPSCLKAIESMQLDLIS